MPYKRSKKRSGYGKNWKSIKNPPPSPAVVPPLGPRAALVAAFNRRCAYHWHSLGLIQVYLRIVLTSAVGFRGAAAALKAVSLLFPTDEEAPSPNGAQMWLLRLGLYVLQQPKEQADDWVWIIDHTIQIGPFKCLIVVGIRLSAWEAKRADKEQSAALSHHDLSVWLIEPVRKSDGPTVKRQLQELSRQTGVVPLELLSDCGGDVQNGIDRFCVDHPQTVAVKDIAHAASNAVKHELNHDSQWASFLRDASYAKAKIRQTQLAFLLPPELKAKARWMNLDPLLTWSRKATAFINAPHPVPGASWEADELEEKMGWIRGYRQPLTDWSNMLEVVAVILTYIREHGYHADALKELQVGLADLPVPAGTPASRVAERLLKVVEEQSSSISPAERLLGSSEVLESLIGKTKQLEGRQSKSGFTKTILGLAASVAEITEEKILAVLSTVKVRDVLAWVRNHLGISIEGQRYHAFASQPRGTKAA